MRLTFNISHFLSNQMPTHKRQANRLALFAWPLNQLRTMWTVYRLWVVDIVYQANITGQKIALENLLNKYVTGSQNAISIATFDDGGIFISTLAETTDGHWISTLAEATDELEIPKLGEITLPLGASFVVYIPTTANADQVNQILNNYVIAGFTFTIQTTI